MKNLGTFMWMTLIMAGIALAGCDVYVGHPEPRHTVYVQQQPQQVVVQEQPQYVEPQPQYVIVQQAPPPIIVEQRPQAPSGLHVWIDGSWNWSNQHYNWQAGHYAIPPQQGTVWVAASYQRDGNNYRYTPGQWKKQHQDNGHNHEIN